MHRVRKLSVFVMLVLLGACIAQAATWKTIDVPGATYTAARGINTRGDIVGVYQDSTGVHGFLLSGGSFTTIDVPGETYMLLRGINDQGKVSGYFGDSNLIYHGFIFDGQNFATYDFPGAVNTFGEGINNAGQVVGGYIDGQDQRHSFELSNGTFTTIDYPLGVGSEAFGINNDGLIVGYYQKSGNNLDIHNYLLNQAGKFRHFGKKGVATAINDHKIIVGFGGLDLGNDYGYRFNLKTNVLTKMRFPGADRTRCDGINKSGQIVGTYRDTAGNYHGFLWTK